MIFVFIEDINTNNMTNFTRTQNLVFFVLMFLFPFFTACERENIYEEIDDSVPETTVVIEDNIWESVFIRIDSSSQTIIFNDDVLNQVKIEPGDYIVSTKGNGLLRKVSSVTKTNEGYTIETEFASLTDVIYEGETTFSTTLSQQNINKITFLKKGVQVDTSMMYADGIDAMDYDIDTYLDNNESIHIYGNFTLDAFLEGELSIGFMPPKVELFDLTYTIDQDLFLAAEIDFSNVNYEDEVDLASVTFNPIIAVMGGVPVLLVPELEIVAGIDMTIFCDVYTDLTQTMDYTIGLHYEDKEWSTINDFSRSFEYTSPIINCSAEARAYIKPQFNVRVFNVVSPYLFADLFTRIDADINSQPWWNLYAGATMGVGIEAEILGGEIFDYYSNPPLIAYEQLIASASGSYEYPPVASFIAQPLSGEVPHTVNFSDLSQYNPYSWLWHFGDGNSSTQQNPTHTYTSEGDYTVTLIVTNENGTDSEVKNNLIHVLNGGGGGDVPVADFFGTPRNGESPLQVSFFDISSNNPTYWSWDFGDGGSSSQQSPDYTYTSSGQYNVSLTVGNVNGSDSETKSSYITVSEVGGDAPIAIFTASPRAGVAPLQVYFDDMSSNNPDIWSWDFGDGVISSERNPIHTYDTDGEYTIRLTVSNDDGSDTEVKSNYILVSEGGGNTPVANFYASPRSGEAPLQVYFEDASSNNPITWSWNFGDGSTSQEQNPIHHYTDSGEYTVTLTVENEDGMDSKVRNNYINVTEGGSAPTADFTATPRSGESPLKVYFSDESLNNPDTWIWDFGDENTSTIQNPEHTYNNVGQYTVKLTVSNVDGFDVLEMNNYITVNESGGVTGEPCPGMPTLTDIDGNVYNTVLIGNQCWMKENLEVTHYPNGDAIPGIFENDEWAALDDNNIDDAYCQYENNPHSEYGVLYTYAAAIADNWQRDNHVGQGICPEGWHLPNVVEWTNLEEYLIANGFNWDGSIYGDKTGKSLASTSGWEYSSVQGQVGNEQDNNNITGFTGLHGGSRCSGSGSFKNSGRIGRWWTATAYGISEAYHRYLLCYSAGFEYNGYYKSEGYSVRCLRDDVRTDD